MFINFINFYQYFIQGFNKIALLLTFMLKTTKLLDSVLKTFIVGNNKVFER